MKYELEPDNRNCPDDVLLDDLRAVAIKLNKSTLTKDDYNKNGRFSAATMQKRFGSWNNALSQSNLKVNKRMRIPQQELLMDLQQVAKKLGTKEVSIKTYASMGKFSGLTISRAFGSWNKALAAAGLEVSSAWHPKASEDELLSNLATVWEKLGRQPKQSDLRQPLSNFSAAVYTRRYGSWRSALEFFVENAADITPAASSADVETPATDIIVSSSRKHRTQRDPSWRLRFLVNRRDRFTCRACGRSPANDIGIVLHVDHIKPWSKGGETTLDNLQTLCERCNIGKSDLPMYEDEG